LWHDGRLTLFQRSLAKAGGDSASAAARVFPQADTAARAVLSWALTLALAQRKTIMAVPAADELPVQHGYHAGRRVDLPLLGCQPEPSRKLVLGGRIQPYEIFARQRSKVHDMA